MSSSLFNNPAPLRTIADAYSGVREPEAGLESAALRLVAKPYVETERRSDGRRGSRDLTAVGSMEYSIDASFVRGAKSPEKGRFRIVAGRFRWRWSAMSLTNCAEAFRIKRKY
jgi:hypothetical protein